MLGHLSVLVAGVLALADPATPPPAPNVARLAPAYDASMLTSNTRRVRTTSPRIRSLLAEGVARSLTFAGLIASLNHSDIIVYIEIVPDLPRTVAGRLLLVPMAGDQRYLRIQVQPESVNRDAIALIGHELRHALEIADAKHVRTQAALIALYEQIGDPSFGQHNYDTLAAQITGRRVRAEMAG